MPVSITAPAFSFPASVAFRLLTPQDLAAATNPVSPDGSVVFLQVDAQGGLRVSNIAELVELRKIFLCLCEALQVDPEGIRVRALGSVADDMVLGVPSIANVNNVPPGNPSASPM